MYEESEYGGAKRDRHVHGEIGNDVRSAAGAPWKMCDVPPHVQGARATAATMPTVWCYGRCLEGLATAKQPILRGRGLTPAFTSS